MIPILLLLALMNSTVTGSDTTAIIDTGPLIPSEGLRMGADAIIGQAGNWADQSAWLANIRVFLGNDSNLSMDMERA